MNNKNTKPSIDPANNGSMEGLLRHVFKKNAQNTDQMMPARVLSYDRKNNRVKVQPLVQMIGSDGQQISRAPIASVPAFRFGTNGALMSFPIQAGDLGWIMAGDRDISLIEQNQYQEKPPNTNRLHSFSNGMFFPDSLQNWQIDTEDMDNVVIATTNGAVKIAFGGEILKITSKSKVVIDTPEIEITGNATIKGQLHVENGIYGKNNLSFENHRHNGVRTGSDLSGIATE